MSTTRKDRLIAFVKENWTWGLVIAAVLYTWSTISPDIDLAEAQGPAPDFELVDMDGRPLRLSDYRGRVVVLNFWATWCPPCRAEIPGFVDLQEEFRDDGVVFVGVSLDDEGFDAVRPFAEKQGMDYPQVVDDGRVARRYGGVGTVPTTFLIDAEGRIRYRHEGLLLEHALRPALEALSGEAARNS